MLFHHSWQQSLPISTKRRRCGSRFYKYWPSLIVWHHLLSQAGKQIIPCADQFSENLTALITAISLSLRWFILASHSRARKISYLMIHFLTTRQASHCFWLQARTWAASQLCSDKQPLALFLPKLAASYRHKLVNWRLLIGYLRGLGPQIVSLKAKVPST